MRTNDENNKKKTYPNTKFHSASYKIIRVNIKSNEDENNWNPKFYFEPSKRPDYW